MGIIQSEMMDRKELAAGNRGYHLLGKVVDVQKYTSWGQCLFMEGIGIGISLEITVCSVIQRLERKLHLASAAIK